MQMTFNAIPTKDELNQMQRDLHFYPATTPAPAVLSKTEVEQFNRDGYVKGLRVYSENEINSVRGYFDGLLARVIAAGGDSYSISTAHQIGRAHV